MKKFILSYSGLLILLCFSFYPLKNAYTQWIAYSELTHRATSLFITFHELSEQVHNAAIIYPELLNEQRPSNDIGSFNVDSASILQTSSALQRMARDSINTMIAGRLDSILIPEVAWIIKSNVPDSILGDKAAAHLLALTQIDKLIKQGKERTKLILHYRSTKLNETFNTLMSWIVVIVVLSFGMLLFTSINLFRQKNKRKEKEEELFKKETHFQSILNNMLEGIQIHDFKWNYIYVNDTLVNYSKYSKEDLIGKTLQEKFPGIEYSDLFKKLNYCMKERKAEHMETEFHFSDGSKADFELSIQPVPEGLFILSIDVTKRKEAERILKKSLKEISEYKFALDESSIIAITNQKGIIEHVNDNFCKISKYTKEELYGQDHRIVNSGYHSQAFIKKLWTTIANGEIWRGELKNKAKDGSIYWVDTSIVPFLNDQGKPYQYLAIRSDITDRKHAEEKLLKANRLYKFLSNINKSIVHFTNEQALLANACNIARDVGNFKLAYIGLLDENKILRITNFSGDEDVAGKILKRTGMDFHDPTLQYLPAMRVLKTGQHVVNNDIQNDPLLAEWKELFLLHEIKASMALPISKLGKTIGFIGFLSATKDFFDTDEIVLLEEAANDISFALENFEKEKKHKETEELIIKNEKRFRGLIEKSADMKTLTNKEGKLTYCSPSVINAFGYSIEELFDMNVFAFFHPDHLPELLEKRNELLGKPGAFYSFSMRVSHKSGRWVWCEGTVTNLLNEPGVESMVSNFRNITEKKLMEEQREFEQNNFDALINSTQDMMWSIDREFRLITFNKAFQESIKNVVGINVNVGVNILGEKFEERILQPYTAFYKRAFSGESFTEIINYEYSNLGWSEVSFYPIYKAHEVIGCACFLRDISERKKHEEQRSRNSLERELFIKELSQNNKDLQQFAYITSHNLRAPIASLLGLSNMLDGFDIKDKVLAQVLAGIKKASLNFDETIQDLNTILTVRDNLNLKKEPLLFITSFNIVLEQCQLIIKESEAEILYNFDLAPQVQFNKSYLESVFVNLITNAIKYRDNSRKLKIHVSTEMVDNCIVLTVSDNGIGINLDAHREKLFKLYQRFHHSKEGKGLGLFLVKSQLEGLGGKITVESKVNHGTKFIIQFCTPS